MRDGVTGSVHGKGWTCSIGLILLAVGVLWNVRPGPWAAARSEEDREEKPRAAGVVEKTGVTLILLDVEARDKNGRPLRGLTKEDFRLKLDRRDWPIYSVDDLCACGGRQPVEAKGQPMISPERGAQAQVRAAPAAPEPIRYVLYIDFSQLQLDGRSRAVQAAKKWVRETKKPDDEAMLAAYSMLGGVRELCPPTRDAARLQAALDEAYADRAMVDTFANGFFDRIEECESCKIECEKEGRCVDCVGCCVMCLTNPLQEYSHGRQALRSFQQFLSRLADQPGRKAVLYFHENGVLFPGSFYPIRNSDSRVGTHVQLLGQVAAEATSSRAAVYPIQTGDSNFFNPLASAAVNLGATLADFTGGAYNRGPSDLFKVIDKAARECACTYRIGFEPPDASHARVYETRLDVGGARLPYRYRVQFLTQDDRVTRKARSVLSLPESSADLPVAAALVPVAAGEMSWSATVQVALDVDAMSLLPIAGSEAGQVDVGALLYRKDGQETWEMLTGSKVRKSGGPAAGSFILYEASLQNLKPGTYRLTAFARNLEMDLFGGAEATLALPVPREGGIAGPIAASPKLRIYPAPFPLRNQAGSGDGQAAQPRMGSVPVQLTRIDRGAPLELVTWLCPAAGSAVERIATSRFLARDDVPIFRLPEPRIEAAGRCFRLTDTADTTELKPGPYTYHLEWKDPSGPRATELAFKVEEGPAKEPVDEAHDP